MSLVTSTGFIITNTHWYTPSVGPQIGIITGKTSHGEVKRYIGTAIGGSEGQDAIFIAENGSRFYGIPTMDPNADVSFD